MHVPKVVPRPFSLPHKKRHGYKASLISGPQPTIRSGTNCSNVTYHAESGLCDGLGSSYASAPAFGRNH